MFEPNLCSYESRGVRLTGELASPDYSEPGPGVLQLNETRDGGRLSRELRISAETYYPGHLAVLLDSSAAGLDTLAIVPLTPYVRSARAGNVRLEKREQPLFHYLHAAALEGRLILEVHQPDLPWAPMRGHLAIEESHGWERPACTGT